MRGPCKSGVEVGVVTDHLRHIYLAALVTTPQWGLLLPSIQNAGQIA